MTSTSPTCGRGQNSTSHPRMTRVLLWLGPVSTATFTFTSPPLLGTRHNRQRHRSDASSSLPCRRTGPNPSQYRTRLRPASAVTGTGFSGPAVDEGLVSVLANRPVPRCQRLRVVGGMLPGSGDRTRRNLDHVWHLDQFGPDRPVLVGQHELVPERLVLGQSVLRVDLLVVTDLPEGAVVHPEDLLHRAVALPVQEA